VAIYFLVIRPPNNNSGKRDLSLTGIHLRDISETVPISRIMKARYVRPGVAWSPAAEPNVVARISIGGEATLPSPN
jgi:hypothetical protein